MATVQSSNRSPVGRSQGSAAAKSARARRRGETPDHVVEAIRRPSARARAAASRTVCVETGRDRRGGGSTSDGDVRAGAGEVEPDENGFLAPSQRGLVGSRPSRMLPTTLR